MATYRTTRLFSEFDEFKKRNKGSLPVYARTSDGSFHDGKVQAETEEEYLQKARKFQEDAEAFVQSRKK